METENQGSNEQVQDDHSIVSRRSILKSSGVGLFGAFGSRSYLSGPFDNQTRIVAARAGVKAEPVHTKKVPKKWLAHQEAVRNVTNQIRKKWEAEPFVGSVSYVATERMVDGVFYSEPEIAVRPNATNEQISRLPDSVESSNAEVLPDLVVSDIKIRRMGGEFAGANIDCFRGVSGRPFPGGLEVRDRGSGGFGTSGCRATDGNSEYLYTANHVFNDSCQVAESGANDSNGNLLGYPAAGHKTHDWLMMNDNGANYSDTVAYEEGGIRVTGYATQSGMESIQGQKGTLRSQGVISGYQNAYVKGGGASFYAGCMKMYGSATKLGTPDYTRSGDSGGPFWWPTSDGNHIVTVLSGFEIRRDYSGCNASGDVGRPTYGYPFWRVANNTRFTIR